MNEEYIDKRFDRIETQLDRIGTALTTLAVIEDRQIRFEYKIGKIEEHNIAVDAEISLLKESAKGSVVNLSWLERIVWMIFVGAISSMHLLPHAA
jgi:hypothetical protein